MRLYTRDLKISSNCSSCESSFDGAVNARASLMFERCWTSEEEAFMGLALKEVRIWL